LASLFTLPAQYSTWNWYSWMSAQQVDLNSQLYGKTSLFNSRISLFPWQQFVTEEPNGVLIPLSIQLAQYSPHSPVTGISLKDESLAEVWAMESWCCTQDTLQFAKCLVTPRCPLHLIRAILLCQVCQRSCHGGIRRHEATIITRQSQESVNLLLCLGNWE